MADIAVSHARSSGMSEAYHRRRWYGLLILSLSLTLIMVDATIVNGAIPSIVKDFSASFRDAEWVNTIYSLVFAATLILWGKIAERILALPGARGHAVLQAEHPYNLGFIHNPDMQALFARWRLLRREATGKTR